MQDPEAEDEVERFLELVEIEGVETTVLDCRVEQLPDRCEPLAPLKLDTPARPDPRPVLLVVHRDDSPRATGFGEERVEAVKGADVEHAQAAEVLGKGGDPVAVVAGDAGGVELVGVVEREGVEPEGDAIKDGSGRLWTGLDRQQISHLALGGSRLRRSFPGQHHHPLWFSRMPTPGVPICIECREGPLALLTS